MNERDAFRAYRLEQARQLKWAWTLKKIEREIRYLTEDLHVRIARELATTRPGQKALHAFTGRTPYGWEVACGTDGRLKKLARRVGWDDFYEIIQLARRMERTPESEWLPAWSV